MTKATTVIGRNGFEYNAQQITADLYVVGKYIVTVEEGRTIDTVCRATKANVARLTR